jgi:hypothetical protein
MRLAVLGDSLASMRAGWTLALVFLAVGVACGRSSLRTRTTSHPGDSGGNDVIAAGGSAGWSTSSTGGHGGTSGTGVGPLGGSRPTGGGGFGTAGTGGRRQTGGSRGGGGFFATGGIGLGGGIPALGGNTGGAMPNGGTGAGNVGGGPASGGSFGTGGNASSGGMSTAGAGGAFSTGGITAGGGGARTGGTGGPGGIGGAVGIGGTGGTGGSMGAGGNAGITCGNGVVDPREACDLGSDNADAPAFVVRQGSLSFSAIPLARIPSAVDFYNYISFSSHTGLETLGMSRLFLYFERSTSILSLIIMHGIDVNTSGQDQPRSQVQIIFSGLPDGTAVALSDDDGELAMTSSTSATGKWTFTSNTDGGVLSGLSYPSNFEIYVSPAFVAGLSTWTWLQDDGSTVELDMDQPLTIKATSARSQCRRDCSIPSCGDGVLDGGEICDQADEACTADCMGFE